MNYLFKILIVFLSFFVISCSDGIYNNPYGEKAKKNFLFSSFQERPKHLDPAKSYSSNEYTFLAQIYEPLLQYHYLKRPYELIPLTAEQMPKIEYLDSKFKKIEKSNQYKASYFKYIIKIKKNINFQPHPAFAKSEKGFRYHNIKDNKKYFKLSDFDFKDTRELTVDDYIYQIKRLADPNNHSPIAGVMSDYIFGFKEFRNHLKKESGKSMKTYQDILMNKNILGVNKINKYSFSITLKKPYPQFIYWLAMPFFSPVPWEADVFYKQKVLQDNNISLNWYPIGTGPYMLEENNPNLRMVLTKNPFFRGEVYPSINDKLQDGRYLPFNKNLSLPYIDKAIYSLEKEQIPRWNKFLQGYYDNSGIASDNYDQAISFDTSGDLTLTQDLIDKKIKLKTITAASTYYIGFNMIDPVIGGVSNRSKYLRQAITIAIDYEEYISIFANGRGQVAHSPLPPGIFGYDINTKSYNKTAYTLENKKITRKRISKAKELLEKAGYVNGIDKDTGEPLILYFEAVGSGADTYSYLNWLRKQFKKINIQLVTRVTDYNRFQDKMIKGTGQIFQWGWNADYPDPENFFFLLYSKNGKVKYGGENAVNYKNDEFDRLFLLMKNMDNNIERKKIINKMINIIQDECPWIWGFHPKSYLLSQSWVENIEPNLMANNTLKYLRVNQTQRLKSIEKWNKPNFSILYVAAVIILFLIFSLIKNIRKRDSQKIE